MKKYSFRPAFAAGLVLLVLCLLVSCALPAPDTAPEETRSETGPDTVLSVTPPTCEQYGYTTYRRADGTEYRGDLIAPLTHDYQPEVVAPTCTESGYTLYRCSRCGNQYQLAGDEALGHHLHSEITAPTCHSSGYTDTVCDRCGYAVRDQYTQPLDHTYDVHVTPATCTEPGVVTYTCRGCGYSYSETGASSAGHSFTAEIVYPDCTSGGYTEYRCRQCGYTYRDNITEPLGHSYAAKVVQPTCSAGGHTEYTCQHCGYSYQTDYTEALGHTFEAHVVSPSCESGGYTEYICRRCGYSYRSDSTEPLGHTFRDEVIPPTCTRSGETVHTCETCGFVTIDQVVPPTDHSYVLSVISPTCEQGGYTSHVCSECGHTYLSDETAPAGHRWEESHTPPSPDHAGTHTVFCSVCDTVLQTSDVTYLETLSSLSSYALETPVYGCDLSAHNAPVDFDRLAASGCTFVILRVGTSNGADEQFAGYYDAARAAGLKIGAYFYTYALTVEQAATDAELALTWLDGRKLDYPLFYDMETEDQEALGAELSTSLICTFLDRILDSGYFAGLYTNKNWLAGLLDADTVTANYCIWLASWTPSGDPDKDYRDVCVLWQYSSTGTREGVPTELDLDLAYVDLPAFLSAYGFSESAL